MDEILHICSKMEIPANPNKKAIIIIEIPSLGVWSKLIKFIPEVSSIKPDKIGIINLVSTFTRLKIGISHNKNIDTKDYVLGKFKDDDWKVLTDSYNKVLDIVENFISKDVNTLKQIYSNKNN